MITREDLERREEEFLAPYAMKSNKSKGRACYEEEHPYRTAFQRDRDRILFSAAFRRLQYKTQVFSNFEGDHYRTRLTHTLEVSHIARSICRGLRLNEDLAEAISLAHDLGHGPFGHIGERVLAECMKKHGGFEHNLQSLRVVEKLEGSYCDGYGLNLTYETKEGLKKHIYDERSLVPMSYATLEAQVADVADSIAYDCHDLDDGLNARLFSLNDISGLKIFEIVNGKYGFMEEEGSSFKRIRRLTRHMINEFVTDLLNESECRLKEYNILSVEDIVKADSPVIGFSKHMEEAKLELEKFLYNNFYKNDRVVEIVKTVERLLKWVFFEYYNHPEKLPKHFYNEISLGNESKARVACDYIAGMTDRYVLEEYYKLRMGNYGK